MVGSALNAARVGEGITPAVYHARALCLIANRLWRGRVLDDGAEAAMIASNGYTDANLRRDYVRCCKPCLPLTCSVF